MTQKAMNGLWKALLFLKSLKVSILEKKAKKGTKCFSINLHRKRENTYFLSVASVCPIFSSLASKIRSVPYKSISCPSKSSNKLWPWDLNGMVLSCGINVLNNRAASVICGRYSIINLRCGSILNVHHFCGALNDQASYHTLQCSQAQLPSAGKPSKPHNMILQAIWLWYKSK